jgi:predicted acylesterase/phospholipase RssA
MNRSKFLAALGGAPLLLALEPPGIEPGHNTGRTLSALVLGGGGARGAYEAGIINAMRLTAGTADGHEMPGVDVVCGTSIGALNAWFVATAQYSKLAELWHGVAKENVFGIKRRFSATANPHAFILTKIVQALSLAQGLTSNVQGILEGKYVADFIERHVDLSTPIVVPFVFTATNLDRARPEIFYRLPFVATDQARAAALARIRRTVGPSVCVRPATDDVIKKAMQASTCIPVLFDPIEIESPEGTLDRYIDGGIADNNPIDVGRALARSVYAVLLDPPERSHQAYANALQIAVGAFGVAQTRILESSLTATYLETRAKRLFDDQHFTGERRAFFDSTLDADLFVLRPQSDLTVQVPEFDRQDKIDATFQQGTDDFLKRGWSTFSVDVPLAPDRPGGRPVDAPSATIPTWSPSPNPTPSATPSSSSGSGARRTAS